MRNSPRLSSPPWPRRPLPKNNHPMFGFLKQTGMLEISGSVDHRHCHPDTAPSQLQSVIHALR